MKKRILSILLAVVMIVGMIPLGTLTAFAEGPQKIGTSDVTWELSADNTVLTIGGTGAMPDFANYTDQPWYSYTSTITTVVINSGVTRIGNKAFMECHNITSLTIPSSVTSIGERAFIHSSKVDTLNIDNIESWCKITFADLYSNPFRDSSSSSKTLNINGVATTDLDIHDTVEAISDYAFAGWGCLTSVTIPSSVKSIGENAFENCSALTSITISKGVETIGNSAFEKCSKLESITLPEGVTTIGEYAFSDCEALKSITLPEGVTTIGEYAFSNCIVLESITLPSTLQSIGDCAFEECESLSTIVAKSTTPPEIYSGIRSYSGDIFVPKGAEEAYKNADNWKKCTISSAYMVNIEATTNGTVTVDKDCFPSDTYTTANETVTVTVTPDEGYKLKSLVWNDGTDHDITEAKSFTMPMANVTVKAEFEEIPTHTHAFIYEADEATLTAICSADGCGLNDSSISITLGENGEFDADALKAWKDAGAIEPEIKYYEDKECTTEREYSGDEIAVSVEASVTYTDEGGDEVTVSAVKRVYNCGFYYPGDGSFVYFALPYETDNYPLSNITPAGEFADDYENTELDAFNKNGSYDTFYFVNGEAFDLVGYAWIDSDNNPAGNVNLAEYEYFRFGSVLEVRDLVRITNPSNEENTVPVITTDYFMEDAPDFPTTPGNYVYYFAETDNGELDLSELFDITGVERNVSFDIFEIDDEGVPRRVMENNAILCDGDPHFKEGYVELSACKLYFIHVHGWDYNEFTHTCTVFDGSQSDFLHICSGGFDFPCEHEFSEGKCNFCNAVEIPKRLNIELIYNGEDQTGVARTSYYYYKLSGAEARDAGDHLATAELLPGYVWTDGTTEPKEISWSIAPAEVYISPKPQWKYLGDEDPELEADVVGLIGDDEVDFWLEREEGDDVGIYDIYVRFDEQFQGNYVLIAAGEEGKFEIEIGANWSTEVMPNVPASDFGIFGIFENVSFLDISVWAQRYDISFEEFKDNPERFVEAYVLNCHPDDVETEKVAYVINSISVDDFSSWNVTVPETNTCGDRYNGGNILQHLEDGNWEENPTGLCLRSVLGLRTLDVNPIPTNIITEPVTLLTEYYLATAPTATEKGTYNQRVYYMDGDNKVIVAEKTAEEDWECTFEQWYLRSMIQYKINEKGDYDIRFISMLNGECFADDKLADYESAGFIINIGGEDIEIKTTVGYTSFLADGKEISISDYSNSTDFFFLANTTFATADIDVNTEIKVTPFVKLIDGETTLEGNTASFTLSQLIKK